MQKNNADQKKDKKECINTKKECISAKNSVDKNLEILKNRLSEEKKGFDYKVTSENKLRLVYNGHELKVDIKCGESLLDTAKLIKAILDDYKKQGFDKKFPKFYDHMSLDGFNTDLKVKNNIIFDDYLVSNGDWISQKMGSNLDKSNSVYANNVQWKMSYNTKALAEFLNEIVKDFK